MEIPSLVQAYQPFPASFTPYVEEMGVTLSCGLILSADLLRFFVDQAGLLEEVYACYDKLDPDDPNEVMIASFELRKSLDRAVLPDQFSGELKSRLKDVPGSHFVLYLEGQSPFDGSLRIQDAEAGTKAVRKYYIDHLSNGLVKRFDDPSYDPIESAPKLIIQQAGGIEQSGVCVSYEPDSRSQAISVVYSSWGLAEDIVRRSVSRDEYFFHKTKLGEGLGHPIYHRIGSKEFALTYDSGSNRLEHRALPRSKSLSASLGGGDAHLLALSVNQLERDLKSPIKLYWCSGEDGLRLLGLKTLPVPQKTSIRFYHQQGEATSLLEGEAVGHSVATGRVRVIESPDQLEQFQTGEVLVADKTEPDWEPYFKRAAALVTARDRRVSHSTILAREMGIPAILNAHDCCSALSTGQRVTVSCSRPPVGRVLEGEVSHQVEEFDLDNMPKLKTDLMVNLSMPERALGAAQLPWAGAGLIRSEFMISGWVKIHPLALIESQRLSQETRNAVVRLTHGYQSGQEYFLDRMSQAIALLAAAFYPRPVTLRLSDFKSDEYANLLGGEVFEPKEANSMLGWRGASRYLDPDFEEAFLLELAAIKRVREQFGFDNIKIMVPFCRTPEEGEEILEMIESAGLIRGKEGFEVWVMAELPSNVFLADEFASLFDGMSIGSSDLTSLTLGVDRSSERLADYFDELHPALMRAYEMVIEACHQEKKPVSFCGQVASEDAEFAALLVEMGIDILSLAPDALHSTLKRLSGAF